MFERAPQRRDGGLVAISDGMAVGGVHVPVLELRGGRQHVVGMVGGVGEEVLQHHGEQVLAREARATLRDSGATATGLLL